MRRTALFLLSIICCLLVFTAASADASYTFRAAVQVGPTEILSFKSGKEYHLCLPGSWDLTALQLEMTGMESFQLGDITVSAGTPVDVTGLLNRKLSVRKREGTKEVCKLTLHQGSPLPVMYITVDPDLFAKSARNKHIEMTEGTVLYTEADGSVTYDGALTQLRGRGNATYSSKYPKKPYQLKLEKKASLSGLGKGKTWLLIANYLDVSLLHNQVALDLCREIGLPYTVGTQQIDVYVNGDYRGLYLLTEKIQIKSTRLNITNLEDATQKLLENDASAYVFSKQNSSTVLTGMQYFDLPADPEDITGGYLLEIEKPYRYEDSGSAGFEADNKLCVVVKEPTYASQAQVQYIGERFCDLQAALKARDGVNPQTGVAYTDYLDITSFAGKFLIEELIKNYDYKAASQYLYKDSDTVDSRFYAGPAWDYDLTFGAMAGAAATSGSYITKKAGNNFWYLLSTHEDFMAEVRSVYTERLRAAIGIVLGQREPEAGSCLRSLDAYAEAISASAAMNFTRWSASKAATYTAGRTGNSFEDGVKRMNAFLTKRFAWMEAEYAK